MTQAGNPSQEDHRGLDYLLTAYLFDSLSGEGRREVERRLAADPSAQAELEELRATLNLVEESLPGAGSENPGAYSFEKSRMERVLAASRKRPVFQLPRKRLAMALAALLVGILSICSIYLLLMGGASPPGDRMASSPHPKAYDARVGEFSEPRYGNSAPADGEGREPDGLPALAPRLRKGREAVVVNEISVGGGAAGAYGHRYGKGALVRDPTTEAETMARGKNKDLSRAELPAAEESEERDEKKLPAGVSFSRIPAEKSARKMIEKIRKVSPQAAEKLNALSAIDKLKAARDSGRETIRQPGVAAESSLKKTPPKPGGNTRLGDEKPGIEVPSSKRWAGKAPARVIDPIGIAGAPAKEKRSGNNRKRATRRITRPKAGEPPVPAGVDFTIVALAENSAGKAHKGGAGKKPARLKELQGKIISFDDASFGDDSFAVEMPETNADAVFFDGDIFFDEEAGGENNGVIDQLAVEGAKFPSPSAQTIAPTNGNYRLNISRQDGRFVPLGNEAGLANPRQQKLQVQKQTLSEDLPEVTAGLAFPDLAQEEEEEEEWEEGAEDLLVVNEDTLNTFSFYRKLDRRLSFEQFRSRTLAIPPPAIGDEGLGEKGFRKKYGVNPFVATSRDHLSTFGMDVDNASWGRARETLRAGELPLIEVVRVEEFVNNFSDERAGNPQSVFTVFTEGGPSPFGGGGLELLQVTIKSRNLLPGERKNAVLTFAVDTSGSMASSGKLELLQESLRMLVSNLGPNDRVAIVAFSTHAYVVLPHTSARELTHIQAAIGSLEADGGTNVEAGIDLAYRLAGESHDKKAANRVLLCSDGVANLGAKGPQVILDRISRFARDNMISLFTYAFGTGGRQAVQGDRMLQRLANEGDGRYQYVDTSDSARNLFSLPDHLQFLASDAKIQVDFNPEVISHYRLLGYEKRDIADVDFRNDTIDAGEVGPGSTVTVLYEIKRTRPIGSLGRIHLRYRDETSRRFEEVDFDLPTGVLAATIADTTDRFRFIAAVAEFAEILRESYYARNGSYGAILQVMDSNSAPWRVRTDWTEAHKLIGIAQGLSAVEHLRALEDQEHIGN